MGLDAYLSPKAIELRDASAKLTEETHNDLLEHIEKASFPLWLIPKI